jgi:hypothetical protein
MRCYNGCPDSDLQTLLDNREQLLNRVRQYEPEAWVTYHFPSGVVVHVWGRELSGYHSTTEAALLDALNKLNNRPIDSASC